MKGTDFLKALAAKLGTRSQTELAHVLGKHPTQVSGFKNRDISPVTVAAIIARFRSQMVTAERLLPVLKTKLAVRTYSDVAKLLGITGTALRNWRIRGAGLSAQQIAGAIAKARTAAADQAASSAVHHLIEFFPVERTLKERHYRIFDDVDGGAYRQGLRNLLSEKRGIYVFYDSRGRALYVGRTTRQTLWTEINAAYNRVRSSQKITLVRHPKLKQWAFSGAAATRKQPKDAVVKLHDLAAFFSAYEVAPAMIANLEALIIRAFPNDLMNSKMERFKKHGAKSASRPPRKSRARR